MESSVPGSVEGSVETGPVEIEAVETGPVEIEAVETGPKEAANEEGHQEEVSPPGAVVKPESSGSSSPPHSCTFLSSFLIASSRPQGGFREPDRTVTETENALLVLPRLEGARIHDAPEMPCRPCYGARGTNVDVWTNYFPMSLNSKMVIYHYDLQTIQPDVRGKMRNQVVRLFLESELMAPYAGKVASDFTSNLISYKKLDLGENDEEKVEILYRSELEDEPSAGARKYVVTITHTRTTDIGDVMSYITSRDINHQCPDMSSALQVLNILINHHAKSTSGLTTVGRNKVFPTGSGEPFTLGRGLCAIRGFYASVRPATARMLMNVNVSHGAFYRDGPLERIMMEFGLGLEESKLRRLEKFLKKVSVTVNHTPVRKNRRGEVIRNPKAILGFASPKDGEMRQDRKPKDGQEVQQAPPPKVARFGAGPKEVQFWFEDSSEKPPSAQPGQQPRGKGKKGKKAATPSAPGPAPTPAPAPGSSIRSSGRYVTVYDFFRMKYEKTVNPGLPVVKFKGGAGFSYLPAEVCDVVSGQNFPRKLSADQVSAMIRFAVQPPATNAQAIVDESPTIIGFSQANRLLSSFGVSVDTNLITVPGRVLTPPKLMYHRNEITPRSGSWNMQGQKLLQSGAKVTWSWLVIEFVTGPRHFSLQDDASVRNVIEGFKNGLNRTGVALDSPKEGNRLRINNVEDHEKIGAKFDGAARVGINLLLILLPDSTPLYKRIKYYGDVVHGMHTVCVITKKMGNPRGQDQYFANVALKFNLKLGGYNQLARSSGMGLVERGNTMIVGIDVTHPSPGSSNNAPSVSAIVASVDKNLSQWPADIRIQGESKSETVDSLREMMRSRLLLWQRRNNQALPQKIVVYRDGVSEGYYNIVLQSELPLLRKALGDVYPPNKQPLLTIVVCTHEFLALSSLCKYGSVSRSVLTLDRFAASVITRGSIRAKNPKQMENHKT